MATSREFHQYSSDFCSSRHLRLETQSCSERSLPDLFSLAHARQGQRSVRSVLVLLPEGSLHPMFTCHRHICLSALIPGHETPQLPMLTPTQFSASFWGWLSFCCIIAYPVARLPEMKKYWQTQVPSLQSTLHHQPPPGSSSEGHFYFSKLEESLCCHRVDEGRAQDAGSVWAYPLSESHCGTP